jgi:hypothetical protein
VKTFADPDLDLDRDLVLVSSAYVGLPPECSGITGEVTRVSFDRRGEPCGAEISWFDKKKQTTKKTSRSRRSSSSRRRAAATNATS